MRNPPSLLVRLLFVSVLLLTGAWEQWGTPIQVGALPSHPSTDTGQMGGGRGAKGGGEAYSSGCQRPSLRGGGPQTQDPSVSAHVTGWKLSVAWPVTPPPRWGTQAPTRLCISLMASTLTLSPLPRRSSLSLFWPRLSPDPEAPEEILLNQGIFPGSVHEGRGLGAER